MSVTLLQHAYPSAGGVGTGTNITSVTTSPLGFSAATSTNSLLICVVYAYARFRFLGSARTSSIPTILTPVTSGYSGVWQSAGFSDWEVPLGELEDREEDFGGAASIFYIANAGIMSSTTTVEATISLPSNTTNFLTVEFALYEFSGAGTLQKIGDSGGSEGRPQTADLETLTNCLILDVMSCQGVAAGIAASGYTLGYTEVYEDPSTFLAQTQYILNASEGVINTAFTASSAGYWGCNVAAFVVITPASVSPTGVSVTSSVGKAVASYAGVAITSKVGVALTRASSNVSPLGVVATALVSTTYAGLGIDYGNIVSGSSGLPPGVNTTNFYVRWDGYLVPSISGLYTIGVNSEDGCNLYLGSTGLIQDIEAIQIANPILGYTQSAQIYLEAGTFYHITFEWQHGDSSNYEFQLIWTTPEEIMELIPTRNMSDTMSSITGVMTGKWWNLTTLSQSSNLPKLINVQLKARLTTKDSAITPVFTGASLDQQ